MLRCYAHARAQTILGIFASVSAFQHTGAGAVSDVRACAELAARAARNNCSVSREADEQWLAPARAVRAWWTGFLDAESGVMSFEACLGSSVGSCDLERMLSVGHDSAIEFGLSYLSTHRQRFCVTVRAINHAGLTSSTYSSDCVRVDATPPLVLTVATGLDPSAHVATTRAGNLILGKYEYQRLKPSTPVASWLAL